MVKESIYNKNNSKKEHIRNKLKKNISLSLRILLQIIKNLMKIRIDRFGNRMIVKMRRIKIIDIITNIHKTLIY